MAHQTQTQAQAVLNEESCHSDLPTTKTPIIWIKVLGIKNQKLEPTLPTWWSEAVHPIPTNGIVVMVEISVSAVMEGSC